MKHHTTISPKEPARVDAPRVSAHTPYSRIGKTLVQVLVVLAVGASGFVSMGTSCGFDDVSIRASQTVNFATTDATRLVRIRLSPKRFRWLELTANEPVVFEQVEPRTTDTSGFASDAGDGCARMRAEHPSNVSADSEPAASICIQPPDTTPSPYSEYLFRVGRGSRSDAFSASIQATIYVRGGCDGEPPETIDLRIEPVD